MDRFTPQDLQTLAQTDAQTYLTITMPTDRVGFETSAIRLKNLLKEAKQQLTEHGHSPQAAEAFLKPLSDLHEDTKVPTDYWQHLGDGLAVFLAEDTFHTFRLPVDLKQRVFVGDQFFLKPFFSLAAEDQRFFVLALSENDVRLYEGNRYALTSIEVDDLPESLEEALFYDDPDRVLQHHTGVPGRRDAIYHGHGVTEEDMRKRPHDARRRYFRKIDEAVTGALNGVDAPLLLAGVGEHLPIYREVNTYRHLQKHDIVAGNPDRLKPSALQEKAWDHMHPLFLETKEAAAKKLLDTLGQGGLASTNLEEIVPAAFFGRVETLFVPIEDDVWGTYDPELNVVELHDERTPQSQALYNQVAIQTMKHGGTVYALHVTEMPENTQAAATFRFPANVEADMAD